MINLRNLDLEILTNVDDKDLLNVCLCNKYMASLCGNQELWRRKLEKIMSNDLIKFKIDEISYKDYYNFAVVYTKYLIYLVIIHGSEQLINDMKNNFKFFEYSQILENKKKIKGEIKKIISPCIPWKYRALPSLGDKIILIYFSKYGFNSAEEYHKQDILSDIEYEIENLNVNYSCTNE